MLKVLNKQRRSKKFPSHCRDNWSAMLRLKTAKVVLCLMYDI